MSSSETLIRAGGLRKRYAGEGGRRGHLALDDVSFELAAGETLGIVGESGSGKSTLARVVMRLTSADGGRIEYCGRNLLAPNREDAAFLTRQVQIVFQDPSSSMNPRRTVRQALSEAARVAGVGKRNMEDRLIELLDAVGLSREKLDAYPHQLSGGKLQRIGIARALAVSPRVIVADECVSALDVSVQSSILNLLLDLQRNHGLAYIFISHDLSVVHHMSDRVAVMKSGRIVEEGETAAVLGNPSHEYTRELIASVPGLEKH